MKLQVNIYRRHGLVILGFDRLLLVVALGIPLMPTVNRDHLKLVLFYTVCLCKQHLAQYFGDSDNRIRVSEPHTAKE